MSEIGTLWRNNKGGRWRVAAAGTFYSTGELCVVLAPILEPHQALEPYKIYPAVLLPHYFTPEEGQLFITDPAELIQLDEELDAWKRVFDASCGPARGQAERAIQAAEHLRDTLLSLPGLRGTLGFFRAAMQALEERP